MTLPAHWLASGDEVIMFKLCGLVRDLQVDDVTEKWSFRLDDGTGSISVEWLSNLERDYTEMGPSEWRQRELAAIMEFRYVRVFGDINTLGKSEPSVTAFHVSAIEIPLEIFDHIAQVARLIVTKQFEPLTPDVQRRDSVEPFLKGQRSALAPGGQPTQSQFQRPPFAAPPSSAAAFGSAHRRDVGYGPTVSNGPTATAILQVLKNMAALMPQGLATDELVAQLWGRGIGVERHDVQGECQLLASRGAILSTEGKWKLVEN